MDFMACHTFCFSDDEANEGHEQRAMRFYDKSGNLADILTWHHIFQPIRSQHLMIQLANCFLRSPEYPIRCSLVLALQKPWCSQAVRWFMKQNLGISEATGLILAGRD
jgi:hypothetical protein